jgi:dihydrofolate synthase/folylpolyglutamate synthase
MIMPETLQDWLRLLEIRHPSMIELGLERVGEVWRELGNPRPAARVFTVAGTNGKGSTVAYIDAMLTALSYCSATYTSPHVFRYNERVRITGKEASDEDLVWAFTAVEKARKGIGLSYFEHGTLAAFLLMQRSELDFAVLEVGLGGRLDAVNLIDADCAVITPIGLDHMEYLGPDRDSIGREKAGILRAGQHAICGEAEPPGSLLVHAKTLGLTMQLLGRDFHFEPEVGRLRWWSKDQEIFLPNPPLAGPHQQRNLATAVAAIAAMLPAEISREDELATGILNVRLSGRLQRHPDDPRVLVDVGHNPLAAEVVAQLFQASGQTASGCVLAMLRDKDAAAVIRILDGCVAEWYCAGLEGERGRSGAELATLAVAHSARRHAIGFSSVAEALRVACRTSPGQQPILVFGSFLAAAQALNTRLPENGTATDSPD